jgi:hypothetical protein
MAAPVVTVTTNVVSDTEIDFSGNITGLPAATATTLTVSLPAASATATATTLATPPPPPSIVPFDPAGTPFVLSSDKLTATLAAAAPVKGGVLVGLGKKAGKWTGAFKIVKAGPNVAVGLANSSYVLGFDYLGSEAASNSIAMYSCGTSNSLTVWLHNNIIKSPPMGAAGHDVDGAVVQWAWDADKDLWYVETPAMRTAVQAAGAWNDDPNADPVAGIGGISTSWRNGATLWVAAGLADQGTSIMIVPPPVTLAGYSPLDA